MFGQYSEFILSSYIISAVTILTLTLVIIVRYKNLNKELAKLDEAGIKRRSES